MQRGLIRNFLVVPGRMLSFSILVFLCLFPAAAQNFTEVKPSPQQLEWQDLEMGAIIHFGPNTFLDREWGDGTADPQIFNPSQFDPEQWMSALKLAGIKYVVMVAKHHDGFCLWPTAQTEYSVKHSPWENGKGDVVGRVEQAARKYGLKFGAYLSPWDRHEPRYSNNAEYDKYYTAELDELAQGYGELEEFWFDEAGSGGHVYNFPRIIEELRTFQPNTLAFADVGLFEYGDIRWVGNEDGIIPYENWNVIDQHGYLRWRPVEADTPLRKGHWFWHPNDEASLKSVAELLSIYEQTVGRGGQLMLGIAPDRRGLLPDADVQRLREFGAAVRERYGKNLVTKRLRGTPDEELALDGNPDTFWSAPAGSHHAELEVHFEKPITFDRTLTMEWLNDGQHIEKYAIEIFRKDRWVAVAQGQAIGHKKIDTFVTRRVFPVATPPIRARCPITSLKSAGSTSKMYVVSPSTKANRAPSRTQIRVHSAAVLPSAAACLAPQREQVTTPSYISSVVGAGPVGVCPKTSTAVPATAPKIAISAASTQATTVPTITISIQIRRGLMTILEVARDEHSQVLQLACQGLIAHHIRLIDRYFPNFHSPMLESGKNYIPIRCRCHLVS